MEKAKGIFFSSFTSNSDRKTDPSLEDAFSDEHFSEKWEEARETAFCQWERAVGAASPVPLAWPCGTTLAVQHEETKKGQNEAIRLRLDDKE